MQHLFQAKHINKHTLSSMLLMHNRFSERAELSLLNRHGKNYGNEEYEKC